MNAPEPKTRWRRRLGLALALALGALLGAAWLAPHLTDWTTRRDQLAAIASARLGQPVSLHGPVRLSLLPWPELEAEGVAVGDPARAAGLGARALRLRLSRAPLLLGRLVPRELVLVGAEIRLPWPPAGAEPGAAAGAEDDWWARLSGLEVEVADSRVLLGGVALEGVQGRLTAGAQSEAVRAAGRFSWAGREVRFDAALGRPGFFDPAVPLDLDLSSGGAAATLRGILRGEGLEGRLEASGPDLSQFLPGPAGAFRGRGRLQVNADLVVADDLALDLPDGPARGAVTVRLRPAVRLDLALAAGRLELDPWIAALRASRSGLSFGLDLSAEAATLRGVTLRRLRASVSREGERLSLTDGAALLPGDTSVELAGATSSVGTGPRGAEAGRMEGVLRFEGRDLRATLDALGWRLERLAPGRLRQGQGSARLVLEDAQLSVADLSATLDGTRISGAGVLRYGARPALGLGLSLDALTLDGLLPGEEGAAERLRELSAALAGFDANLRLAADRLLLRGVAAERVSLDAAAEDGRLTLRRAAGQVAGADLALSGVLLPPVPAAGAAPPAGAPAGAASPAAAPLPRLSDLAISASVPDPRALLALVPGPWPDASPMAAEAMTLRLSGNGPPDALAVRTEADWAGLRLESAATLDLPGRRGSGSLTLRHPGAPRLLTTLLGPWVGQWMGDGSLSLIASGQAGPQGITAERFDLVAGGLRTGGVLALGLDGPRPRLTGRLQADALPLPLPGLRSPAPLPLEGMRGFDAVLDFTAARIGPFGPPPVEEAEGHLRLAEGVLRLELARGRLEGGALSGVLGLDGSGPVPVLSLEGRLEGASLPPPPEAAPEAPPPEASRGNRPLQLRGGALSLEGRLNARGNSAAALLATLGGDLRLSLREGSLVGLDADDAWRAATAGIGASGSAAERAEAALRAALAGGVTAIGTLDAPIRLSAGRMVTESARATLDGASLSIAGELDLPRDTLALALSVGPPADAPAADPAIPPVGLRLTGPRTAPARVPDLSAWLRARAERGG